MWSAAKGQTFCSSKNTNQSLYNLSQLLLLCVCACECRGCTCYTVLMWRSESPYEVIFLLPHVFRVLNSSRVHAWQASLHSKSPHRWRNNFNKAKAAFFIKALGSSPQPSQEWEFHKNPRLPGFPRTPFYLFIQFTTTRPGRKALFPLCPPTLCLWGTRLYFISII